MRFFKSYAKLASSIAMAAGLAVTPAQAQVAACRFVLGFQTLHSALASVAGDCVDDQASGGNGDALQHTTKGLLVWRKADNWTAFTDGFRTWVNGPNGIQQRLNTQRFPWEWGVQHSAPPQSALTPTNPSSSVIATGLEVPWALSFAPDGRAFVTERVGRIRIVQSGVLQAGVWATLPVAARPGNEGGLLGLAVDSDFSANHFLYVYYTYAGGSGLANRIVRMVDSNGSGTVDRVLLDGIPAGGNHDGGRLAFGPDGKLYATTGEAGVPALAQDLGSLGGKILRLERDGSVPADNPFAGSYVYSLGHRNVEGIAWHPEGGLYETEHGPSGAAPFCCNDEINLIDPGVNYGWPAVYGNQSDPSFRDALLQSGAATTWAPTGAAFIRQGPLAGSLLFTGLQSQALHRVVFGADGRTVLFQEQLLRRQIGRLRDVEPAPDGLFWVLTSNRDGRGSPSGDDDRIVRVSW